MHERSLPVRALLYDPLQEAGMNLSRRIFVFLACAGLSFATGTQTLRTPDTPAKVDLIPGLDKSLIDTTADPCVDFAAYACGNFAKLYPIPPDKSSYGPGAIVYDYTQQVLHDLLDKVATDDPKRTPTERKSATSMRAA